jgi:hypothetical protein
MRRSSSLPSSASGYKDDQRELRLRTDSVGASRCTDWQIYDPAQGSLEQSRCNFEQYRTARLLEFQEWRSRSLADFDIVYCWADSLYVKAGIEDGKAALSVTIGATRKGETVVQAVESGQRESRESLGPRTTRW